ncbi:PSL4 [Symbiodinium sp. KB8]|nr:PSL4 [Symbiodinium sp. KB8]
MEAAARPLVAKESRCLGRPGAPARLGCVVALVLPYTPGPPLWPGLPEALLPADAASLKEEDEAASRAERAHRRVRLGGKWRDLALVASVTALNTVLASSLPLLGGKPQPLLISTIFDKTLMQKDPEAWVLPWAGVAGTLALCFLMKWCMTILALSSAIPAGVVAPTMIIGGLLGRVYAHVLLPDWFVDLLLSKDGLPPSELQRGAFMARCGIVGASAFCAAVCRAFAMAITVFEVLALPNSVLPLCSSALTAIFVANKVSLPFFDANLATRNLGGIPAITFTDKAIEPVMKVMTVADMSECLPQMLTLRHLLHVLTSTKHDFFPIVRPLAWDVSDKGLLEGTMTRKNVERLVTMLDPRGETPDREIDLMDPQFQAPPDGSEALVEGSPVRVSPDCTVKDVYLLMKVAESDGVVYVTDRGLLQGHITLSTLMSREGALRESHVMKKPRRQTNHRVLVETPTEPHTQHHTFLRTLPADLLSLAGGQEVLVLFGTAAAMWRLLGALSPETQQGAGRAALAMVRGVAPDLQGRYSGATFRCGSTTTEVQIAEVNDDFCDCPDGSDEPGTGACAGASEALFHCSNAGSAARLVYVSRVGDGICDCCDGSDEEASRSTRCPNTCREEGERLQAERERKLKDLRAGLEVKQQTITEAKQSLVQKREDLDRLLAQLPELEARLGEARKRKEELEAVKLQEECKTELPRLREKVKSLEAKIASLEAQTKGADAGASSTSTTSKVVSEYAKWMEGADAMQEPEEEPEEPEEEPAPSKPEEEAASQEKASGDSDEDPAGKELKELEAQVKSEQALRERLERELQELPEEMLGFASLRDKCLEHKTSEYTYKLCFFKDAKQSFTRLGTWSGFTSSSEALFKDGDMCYGGPARTLKVVFECGAEEEVVEVSEPSRCTYQALVRHAGACLEEAEASGAALRHPKDEL